MKRYELERAFELFIESGNTPSFIKIFESLKKEGLIDKENSILGNNVIMAILPEGSGFSNQQRINLEKINIKIQEISIKQGQPVLFILRNDKISDILKGVQKPEDIFRAFSK